MTLAYYIDPESVEQQAGPSELVDQEHPNTVVAGADSGSFPEAPEGLSWNRETPVPKAWAAVGFFPEASGGSEN